MYHNHYHTFFEGSNRRGKSHRLRLPKQARFATQLSFKFGNAGAQWWDGRPMALRNRGSAHVTAQTNTRKHTHTQTHTWTHNTHDHLCVAPINLRFCLPRVLRAYPSFDPYDVTPMIPGWRQSVYRIDHHCALLREIWRAWLYDVYFFTTTATISIQKLSLLPSSSGDLAVLPWGVHDWCFWNGLRNWSETFAKSVFSKKLRPSPENWVFLTDAQSVVICLGIRVIFNLMFKAFNRLWMMISVLLGIRFSLREEPEKPWNPLRDSLKILESLKRIPETLRMLKTLKYLKEHLRNPKNP